MTYTCAIMAVSQETYDEIRDYVDTLIKTTGDYHTMLMDDEGPGCGIDMTHVALEVGPRPDFMPPRPVSKLEQCRAHLRILVKNYGGVDPIFGLERKDIVEARNFLDGKS